MPVTREEAAAELLRRKKARETLPDYIYYVSGKNPPRHMRFLCDKLEDLSARKTDRLLVAFPPGHGKSFCVSWHFPAYYLSKNPTHNIVAVSHTDSFAETWGRRVRNLMLSDEHKRLFPDITISEDSRAAGRWDLVTGGSYFATGVGGAVTGKRANCFTGDTLVTTENGDMRLDHFVRLVDKPRVLAYNHDSGVLEYKRVLATKESTVSEILQIDSPAWSAKCTPEHRIFTCDNGYVEAEKIASDGRACLLTLRGPILQGERGLQQGSPRWSDRFLLFCNLQKRALSDQIFSSVPHVQEGESSRQRPCLLLSVMYTATQKFSSHCMRILLCAVSASHKARALLRETVRQIGSFSANEWGWKFQVQGHNELQRAFQKNAATYSGEGFVEMLGVQQKRAPFREAPQRQNDAGFRATYPSCEREAVGQQTREPGDSVFSLPQGPPRVGEVTSNLVSRLRQGRFVVYDIQVEGCRNFFANGVLVHNCILLDDVFRGIEDADSATIREAIWNWYGADLYTRLVPGGVIGFINTRFHLDDLAGRLLAAEKRGGEKWTKIILPAIAKDNDLLGRKEGEALWPEWQDVKALEKIRDQPAMTARLWSALYQQDPVIEDGNVLKRSWFKIWQSSEPPKCNYIVQSWDTAASNKDKAAYSAVVTLGVFDDPHHEGMPAVILLSASRARLLYPEVRKWAQRASSDYLDDHPTIPKIKPGRRRPDMILIEDKSTGTPLLADFMRAGISAFRVNPQKDGGKDTRLHLVSDVIENGRFYIPGLAPNFTMPRKFADEFVTEICSFPAASSRDYADALSQGLIRIKRTNRVKSTDDPIPVEFTRLGRGPGTYY